MQRVLPAAVLLACAAACAEAGPCPMPLEVCGGSCIDLRSDPRHCGGCGRACGAGLACADGQCGASGGGTCASRGGGAFVTLGVCGQTVKLWITSEEFVASAEALVQGGDALGLPVLTLLAGSDCDPQWTWHVDGTTAAFAAAPPSGECAVCPGALEAAMPYYVQDVGIWCPSPVTVVSVDRR